MPIHSNYRLSALLGCPFLILFLVSGAGIGIAGTASSEIAYKSNNVIAPVAREIIRKNLVNNIQLDYMENSRQDGLYSSMEIPRDFKGDSIELNNFELIWTKIPLSNLRWVSDYSISNNLLSYINQDEMRVLKEFNLNESNVSLRGGIKSVFEINNKKYLYIVYEKNGCAKGAVFAYPTKDLQFEFPCMPQYEFNEFAATGGAFVSLQSGKYLLSTGTPTSSTTAEEINNLAQDDDSPYGKILEIYPTDEGKLKYRTFSKGHRNPQGLVEIYGRIYSVEHGPRGGDEINEISDQGNYGWPLTSLGSHYDFKPINKDSNISEKVISNLPVFSFMPSIGISDIGNCPISYEKYYYPFRCLAISSMRAGSIYFLVLHPDKSQVMFTEQIKFGPRISKFKFIGDTLVALTDFQGIILGFLELSK